MNTFFPKNSSDLLEKTSRLSTDLLKLFSFDVFEYCHLQQAIHRYLVCVSAHIKRY